MNTEGFALYRFSKDLKVIILTKPYLFVIVTECLFFTRTRQITRKEWREIILEYPEFDIISNV